MSLSRSCLHVTKREVAGYHFLAVAMRQTTFVNFQLPPKAIPYLCLPLPILRNKSLHFRSVKCSDLLLQWSCYVKPLCLMTSYDTYPR
ncbi:hypothetical protein MLD38_035519 [Melastoma candidum]|uniref:Uncharacterized protein n=1 Tax=Melastoma candidum TaxID=119954 RepID=A0ACB9LHG9_9MYRT|nr:hypothetical protein MLD38_035519 [Melastoma candidum]